MNKSAGLALLCDEHGNLIKILSDQFGIGENCAPGRPFTQLVAHGSLAKALSFLTELRINGLAVDWEINIALGEQIRTLHFAGGRLDRHLLIVAAESGKFALNLYDEMISISNEQTNALRAALKEQRPDNRMFDEISRLNNELTNMQRELAGQNAQLQREIHERKLAENQARFQATLLDAVGQAVIATNSAGMITYLNRAAENLYGWPANEAVGQSILNVTVPQISKAQALEIMAQLTAGQMWSGEFLVRHRNGRVFPALVHDAPIFDEAGTLIGIIGISSDITARKQTEEALHLAKKEADTANQAKSKFLAGMSHELRTPLNGILGFTQILKHDPKFPDVYLPSIETIERSGQHLLSLIADILDLARVEAGKMELLTESFDLIAMLNDLMAMIRVRAAAKNLALIQTAATPLPRFVLGDEKRLRQILLNLLSNAIKFTARGQVELLIAECEMAVVESTSEAPRSLMRFAVTDTGAGLTAAERQQLFQDFSQVGDAASKAQGTGLGLAISQRLTQLMGGQLSVASTPGQGSTFSFTIPLQIDPSRADEAAPSQKARIIGLQSAPPTILIVDDNPVNRKVLRGILEPLGILLLEAETGEQAVRLATDHRPAAILMDLFMPGIDGLEATRQILTQPELKDCLILAISADVYKTTRVEALQAGCVDFLSKPVDASLLLDRLTFHLKLQWLYAEPVTAAVTEMVWPRRTSYSPC